MASKTKALQDSADRIFSKRYTLKSKNDIYTLPSIDAMYSTGPYDVESLTNLRDKLNATKSLLNDKDLEQWRRHTSKTNPCGLVVKHLRDQVNPEMCTQAWAKFYEIVSTCDVIPADCVESKSLNSLHLCEAPGAFVASLNHCIQSKFEVMQWSWLASTLNPFYEGNDTKRMIEGERFILETREHWNFGENFDGDIMSWRNLVHLQNALEGSGKANIITADGSIDCANEPEKQETIIGQLLFCEVVAALTLLAPGGSFIVKMFTMFEHNTICVLYLLCCVFTQIEIVKPGTSKAGNSEVYCVCTSFVGTQKLSRELLDKLQSYYTSVPPVKSMFPQEMLPADFLKSIKDCATLFSSYQIDAITRNIALFEKSSKGKRKFLSNLRQYIAEEYIRRFSVAPLEQRSFVVPRVHLSGRQLSCWPEDVKEHWCNAGYHTGCYQERMEMAKLGWQDRVVFPCAAIGSFKTEEDLIRDLMQVRPVQWLRGSPTRVVKSDLENWTTCLGKSITKVQSSRFCPSALIEELNEARMRATVLHTVEGRHLIENVEQDAQERLRCASLPQNSIVGVLQKCYMIGNQSKVLLGDVSGDCRFLHELDRSEFSQHVLCSGLLCRNCAARLPSGQPSSKVHVVTASSCSMYRNDEASHLKELCRTANGSFKVVCGTVFTACTTSSEIGYDELATRTALVNQCLVALQILNDGDSFVCEVSDTLTQFTVGVIYILHLLFREISLCPSDYKLRCSPRQFLVCRSYVSANNDAGLAEYMMKIRTTLEGKSPEKDVVCLVPIANLFSDVFYKYIRQHSTHHVENQLNSVVDLERILLTNKCTSDFK